MEQLLRTIAMALVDDPDKVCVSVVDGNQTMILTLKVAKVDTGHVIGRHGRMAGAIRTILNAAGAKHNKRIILDIEEDHVTSPIVFRTRGVSAL